MSSLDLKNAPAVRDSVDYLQRAARAQPFLEELVERELAVRARQGQDREAADALALAHLRLVTSIARQYGGYGLPEADLIQEGNVGLLKAIARFDPERGVRLSTFAMHWIKTEIHEFVMRNARALRIATTKPQRKLFFGLKSRLRSGSLRMKEIGEIARDLDVDESEVIEMEKRFYGHDLSLDYRLPDGGAALEDCIAAPHSFEPEGVLARKQRDHLHGPALHEAIGALDERSREIVVRRWLDDANPTLKEMGDEMALSGERVRQIEAKAFRQLREQLVEHAACL